MLYKCVKMAMLLNLSTQFLSNINKTTHNISILFNVLDKKH